MKSIKTRISIYVLIVSIACSLIIGCFSLINYKHNLEEYMGQKALDISKAVSANIDGDKIAEYDKTEIQDEYYQEIADYLGRVKSEVDLKYLYIMVDAGSDYKYIVEGVGKNDTEEPSLLGDTQPKGEYGPETAEALSTGEGAYSDIYDNGEFGDLLSGFAPIFDSKGNVTGVVGLDIGVDMLEKSIAAYLPILLLIMVLTCGVSYLLISIVVRKTVVEPLKVLEDVSSQLSGGHFDIQIPQAYLSQPDEIGNLSRAFVKVSKYLKSITQEIAHVLIESANKNSGIAQALAEGSNEQASAIEELFASIHTVSADVAQNAEDVNLANNFVAEVGESVVVSNDDMQRLLAAMNEIDESSRQIADIIKIIDNITFQTKILSLNASVEAALAGKSGKGFAVVAEEVRNLALRSADAAKKTAALIENTLGSVRKGTEIAEVTAQALANVSDKTHLVNDIIYKITEASKGQAVSISKIQQSIDQISVIVQRNSSAAEDSALASEELCKQAAQLRKEISEIAHT